ncbi:hypothetical protein ACIRPQ_29055 [Streptomyces sp. NPDC101213]|uniref:hypothetical protein n=1 Tax=Streptomyces sp. NPDC101213 TaxID=3366130 RepID=UPI00380BE715
MTPRSAVWAATAALTAVAAGWASAWPWPSSAAGHEQWPEPAATVLPVRTPAVLEPAWTHTCIKGTETSCPQAK